MYKFEKSDVDKAIEQFGKKGYKYTRRLTIKMYSLKGIPIKALYEHILFDKGTVYDGTGATPIRERLIDLGYKVEGTNNKNN